MTEDQLIYFTTIVDTGSYSETALELDISQSSISKQIMSLENELGVKLFDRSGRNVTLTEPGRLLYDRAKSLVQDMKSFRQYAMKLGPKYEKRIRILTLPITGQSRFFITIQGFEMLHPEYNIELVELEEPALFRQVAKGDYDMAITYFDPTEDMGQGHFCSFFSDELMLAVPKDHSLAAQEFISVDDLHQIPLYAMNKYTCVSHLYDALFKKHRFVPQIVFRGRPETILGGAEAGKCCALITDLHARYYQLPNVKLIPFRPTISAKLGVLLASDRERDPVCLELIEKLTA